MFFKSIEVYFYDFTFSNLTANICTGLWSNIPKWTFQSVNSIKTAQEKKKI